jgi:hypothetical protein
MRRFLFGLAAVLGIATASQAGPVSTSGLTFSEQSGNFVTTGVSGVGTSASRINLSETFNAGAADVVVRIEGIPTYTAGNNGANVGGFVKGFFMTKTVTNNTGVAWTSFDMELQEILGTASSDGDGLSFAQEFGGARPFTSDKFSMVDEITDDRDFINFSGGVVNPGETVTFMFAVTDNSPLSPIYLRQRPNFRVGVQEVVPEPLSVAVFGGLVAVGGLVARRRTRVA